MNPPDPPDLAAGQTDHPVTPALCHMDCDDVPIPKAPISYKDMVIDMHQSSSTVQQLDIKSMDYTLIVKVLGRMVGYNTLHNRIYTIWKPSHPINLVDIENNYFLVKFSCQQDYLNGLSDGPWTIFGHYLTIEPWSVDFCSAQSHLSRMIAWTPTFRPYGCEYKSVHPLVSKIDINGRTQIVEYEALPTVWFECGIYGHVKDICPKIIAARVGGITSDSAPNLEPSLSLPNSTSPAPNEAFGPCMMVEKKKRSNQKKSTNTTKDNGTGNIIPSSFASFSSEESTDVVVEDPQVPFMDSPFQMSLLRLT
ncbi:uncharacterized protein LOC120184190 [Hibiscus syriacus]|uniref:uncharacterized protein LOC120184190 n=1 Tax=Hibiscus syriacus TaxID=106335 RepID=UPI0019205C47|nr:uncharacterized protein LOC120184190 [Hibiscus syriacus]